MSRYINILYLLAALGLVLHSTPWAVEDRRLAAETGIPQAAQAERGKSDHTALIIDPGHGGNDTGVRLAGGQQEKELTWVMGKMLQEQLVGVCRVGLTRKEDLSLTAMERSAQANQNHGDLLVSLHIAGGFVPRSGPGITIFHSRIAASAASSRLKERYPEPAGELTPWFQVQHPFLPESRRVAQLLAQQLSADLPTWTIGLISATLAVLDGAEMPAVLIEIDPPAAEDGIDPKPALPWIEQVTRSIAETLQSFWNRGDNGPIIQDLHE